MKSRQALSDLDTNRTALIRLKDELVAFSPHRSDLVSMALCALLAEAHILIEDVPGIGKTTFIKALAQLTGLSTSRVQCTSDLLPSDVIGVQVFDEKERDFCFHPGPIFSHIVIVDELNRASPRTQSALLEAMGESQVTVDRKTTPLPRPFLVFAAQNPMESAGTYPLPDSQLDRFALRLTLGYPAPDQEWRVFRDLRKDPLTTLSRDVLTRDQLLQLMQAVEEVRVSDAVAQYVHRVIERSRTAEHIRRGISTRGGVIWLRLAAAHALLEGRSYVIPDDLQYFALPALAHRIVPATPLGGSASIDQLIQTTPVA